MYFNVSIKITYSLSYSLFLDKLFRMLKNINIENCKQPEHRERIQISHIHHMNA